MLSASVFVAVAIGGEFIGGYWCEFYGVDNLAYGIITMFEESFEMIGVLIFIHALLSYLSRDVSDVCLKVEG